jgi:hypothetical protein
MCSRPFAGEVAARVNSVGFAMSEMSPLSPQQQRSSGHDIAFVP